MSVSTFLEPTTETVDGIDGQTVIAHPDDPDRPKPGMRTDDPEAPYGVKSDGTPRAKPGRRTGTPNTRPRKAAAPRAPQPAAPAKGRRKAPAEPDYRGGVMALVQVAATPLIVAGAKSETALADAAALTLHGPPIADALHTLALERPEVAAVLERLMQVGPYGVLIAAVVPLAVQLAANHGLIPEAAAAGMGAHPRGDLVAYMKQPADAPAAA